MNTKPLEYVVIKALEDGVNISSVISNDGIPVLNERLDEGEIFLLVISENYLGVRIRGKAEIDTALGKVIGESRILFH